MFAIFQSTHVREQGNRQMRQINGNTFHVNHDNMFAFLYWEVHPWLEYKISNGKIKYDPTYLKRTF